MYYFSKFDNLRNSKYTEGREISVIIVTDDYLCYKEPKSPYNFSLILIFNEIFKFKKIATLKHGDSFSAL